MLRNKRAWYAVGMMKYAVWAIVAVVIIGGGYYGYTQYMNTNAERPSDESNLPQVQAQDSVVGEGEEAAPGLIVSVLYTGRFTDGTVFDSSAAHGNQPLEFVLGTPGLIPGFQIGVNGMKVGGKRTMVIPPELGYGAEDVKDNEGNVVIPGNSTLVFEVELLKVAALPPEQPENAAE